MYTSLLNQAKPGKSYSSAYEEARSTQHHDRTEVRISKKLAYEDQVNLIDEREELQPEKLSIIKTPTVNSPEESPNKEDDFISAEERAKARILNMTRNQPNNSQYSSPSVNNSAVFTSQTQNRGKAFDHIYSSIEHEYRSNDSFMENEIKCKGSYEKHEYHEQNKSSANYFWAISESKTFEKLNNSHYDSNATNYDSRKKPPRPQTAIQKINRSVSVDKTKTRFDGESPFYNEGRITRCDEVNKSVSHSRNRSQNLNDSAALDECYRSILKERKEKVEEFKKQAAIRYQNKTLKIELENQMKMLENRVKRLHSEDFNMQKSIKKTEQITKKAVEAKKRHQEDLQKVDNLRRMKLQEEENNRRKAQEEKMRRVEKLQQSLDTSFIDKHKTANQVKKVLYQESEKSLENQKKDEMKKVELHDSTFMFERELKYKKIRQQSMTKEQMNEMHLRHLQEEHKRTMDIQEKIKMLAAQEELLIHKIRNTHKVQREAEDYMQKVVKTKVDKNTPLKF